MPYRRLRRLIQGQGGSTVIELLVAMPVAILLLGLVVQALGSAGLNQRDIERRTRALITGQVGLERMTREIRQAGWVYFSSSSVIDLAAPVRPSSSAPSVERLVRYDCSSDACIRREGPATAYPPPAAPTFTEARLAVGSAPDDASSIDGRIIDHDVFRPTRVDPATGLASTDFLTPDYVRVHVRLAVDGRAQPVVLDDGVSLRNRTDR